MPLGPVPGVQQAAVHGALDQPLPADELRNHRRFHEGSSLARFVVCIESALAARFYIQIRFTVVCTYNFSC